MTDPLCGTYYPSIDQKGRMSFPNKLREILGPEFFLCAGHDDHYIAVYLDEQRILHRKKQIMAPGEMEQVILTKKQLLAHPDLRQVTICLEDE